MCSTGREISCRVRVFLKILIFHVSLIQLSRKSVCFVTNISDQSLFRRRIHLFNEHVDASYDVCDEDDAYASCATWHAYRH